MRPQRIANLQEAESLLIGGFPVFVAAFSKNPTFTKSAQLATHLKTIEIRRGLGSAQAAIHSEDFLEALYKTLRAWGIGLRGSRLLTLSQFAKSLETNEGEIAALEASSLDSPGLDVNDVVARVWHLIKSVRLVDNRATLVPSTKALHHLLPDLVVPMDRAFTRPFFGWHGPEFQNHQDRCFAHAFRAFHRVALAVNPKQYVGDGWNTSLSKVMDNAVCGAFVVGKTLLDSQRSTS